MNTASVNTSGQRFVRLPEVMRMSGLSKPSVYRLMAEGEFPRPVKIGLRSVAWPKSDIDQWMAERLSDREVEA